ncbi:hypothetical protein ZWY2020_002734 [Hordeum vulgare]|nr:hypothetical protein ZWY2020_002734 [Hordeum vulgare]
MRDRRAWGARLSPRAPDRRAGNVARVPSRALGRGSQSVRSGVCERRPPRVTCVRLAAHMTQPAGHHRRHAATTTTIGHRDVPSALTLCRAPRLVPSALRSGSSSRYAIQRLRRAAGCWLVGEWRRDDEDEDDDGAEDGLKIHTAPVRSAPAEALHQSSKEASQRVMLDMWIPTRKTESLTALRPWIGPIPKVHLSPITLSDFIKSDSSTLVSKKKNKQPAPRPAPASVQQRPIRDVTEERLKTLLAECGTISGSCSLGSMDSGYMVEIRAHERGGYRPTWGGKGGGKKPRPPFLSKRTTVLTVAVDKPSTLETVSGAKAPDLSGVELATVKALAEVIV